MNGRAGETETIFRTSPYVAVVGGINMDIGGRSHRPIIPGDSNPGYVSFSPGGVGRNIAHNLCLLGIPVVLLGAVGDDFPGREAARVCREAGMDFDRVLTVPGMPTSVYLYLLDSNGEMYAAVNDMAITKAVTPDYLAANLEILNHASAVVVDANIPEASIRFLAEHVTAPIYADPVSAVKAPGLSGALNRLHAIKPNRAELEALIGGKTETPDQCEAAVRALLSRGVEQVYLSLGAEGLLAADGNEILRLPAIRIEIQNATGAGDAFLAGVIWAALHDCDLYHRALAGRTASLIAIESAQTVSPGLSEAELNLRMKSEEAI